MTEQVAHVGGLGWIVIAIAVGSILFTVLAAILVKPRRPRVTLLLMATLFALLVAVVGTFWVGGLILSVLMG